MGTLYTVATPIGNLEDVTLRALRVLGEVALIAAEDTRTIRKLLARHGVRAPRIVSYTERNRRQRTPAILDALKDADVALVSEAGTPGVSDPGIHLVEAAAASGFTVSPIPGPSALTAALAASGLPTRRFHYLGFLPRAAGARRRLLDDVASLSATLVAFEAPHRLRDSLGDLLEALGDRRIAVCRELTKVYEEVYRGTVSGARERFSAPRGEFTLVIEGATATEGADRSAEIDARLQTLKREGARARDAVRAVVEETGASRQQVYRRWLALNEGESGAPIS